MRSAGLHASESKPAASMRKATVRVKSLSAIYSRENQQLLVGCTHNVWHVGSWNYLKWHSNFAINAVMTNSSYQTKNAYRI